ncbi:Alpha/Beta hydrolase protein [Triangularia verruculosa]|uniref:Alpha/Beta hydrolase protein n=1 Tax=Triangularia verruculosa TaxID=2587418 RepID=A0AAN6XGB5_9PEZI|nr:Alpha/Beta hydrolase protein [Triangularia verruculosa]
MTTDVKPPGAFRGIPGSTRRALSAPQTTPPWHRRRRFALTGACMAGLFLGFLVYLRLLGKIDTFLWPFWNSKSNNHIINADGPIEPPTFNWIDITPSRTLVWHPCYSSDHDCARLDVPMDWQSPSDSSRVVLAIIRLRASTTAAANKTAYRGPVFFNPGGPGGSGIWSLLDHGKELQVILGKEHYDLVSFDPRGIGNSVPRIECWSQQQDRGVWDLQDSVLGTVDAHPGVVYDSYARAYAFSQVCETNPDLAGADGILRHSSTAYHARDMLEIIEQMGEEKLKYWGFSYGTVLGGTFAALWPNRVERMVNDGNVDYVEWYQGGYVNFLHDTDVVMEAFFTHCHRVGPLLCAFYSPTPSQIKFRLFSLLDSIRQSPILVIQPTNLTTSGGTTPPPEIITYSKLRKMLSTALYQPSLRFPRIATVLSALESRNGIPYISYTNSDSTLPSLCLAESIPPSTPLSQPQEGTPDAFPAVLCSDASYHPLTPSQFAEYAALLQNISYAAGAVQAEFRLSCIGRTIRPKWELSPEWSGIKTAFPILFVNNHADNVTPLVSARNNSRAFPGSAVLVQEGYGHTTLAAPSRCTAEKIRGYFQRGELPPGEGVGCKSDRLPFDDDFGGQTQEEDELTVAVRKLARKVRIKPFYRGV